MPHTLYVASSNPGKLHDFAAAAEAHSISVLPIPGLDIIAAPDETGVTFEDNARLKAVYYSRLAPGALVIADDSGLEVDALNGEPGVRSARFAADAGFTGYEDVTIDQRNNLYLLERMASNGAKTNTARYRCVIALAQDGEVLLTTEGSVEGEILTQPRGTGGFGYDPLFFLPTLRQTMAEIDLTTKHTLSHRGKAFSSLLEKLPSVLSS